MEEKVRVQDDLYMFTNKEWLDKAVIPADKPTTGGFADLATQVEDLLIADFNKMSKGKMPAPDGNTSICRITATGRTRASSTRCKTAG